MLKYNRHTDGKTIECSDEVFEAYKQLKDVRKELDAIEERKSNLEETIKWRFWTRKHSATEERPSQHGKPRKRAQNSTQRAFQAAHPDLAKEFTTSAQGARPSCSNNRQEETGQ